MHLSKSLLCLMVLATLISCETKEVSTQKKDVLFENMDSTMNPGTDIFLYANGNWIKNNPIPGDQGSWGIGQLVIEENLKRLREIAEQSARANAAKGTAEQKIGDFWLTAMDSADWRMCEFFLMEELFLNRFFLSIV